MQASKASYAQALNKNATTFKRPNCLSFRTSSRCNRDDIFNILKDINFSIKKLVGIAEMRGNNVDVTCTNREHVLELYNKLSDLEFVKFVRLYESDKTNVAVGWVPIPFPNELIEEEISAKYGKVQKIMFRKDKENLLTGMRIVSMNATDLENNPIPSYIRIGNCEFYVTYHGQIYTCKYCDGKGHKQAQCPKRLEEFPELKYKAPSNAANRSPQSSVRAEEADKDGAALPTPQGNEQELNLITDDDERKSEAKSSTPQRPAKRLLSPQELPASKSISLCEDVVSLICPGCKSEAFVAPESKSFKCWKCSKKFSVAVKCCKSELFLIGDREQICSCPECHSAMRRLPCCREFQPELKLDEGTFECVQCLRYSIMCDCKTVNILPKKTMAKACTNRECRAKIINCECGKQHKQILEPSQPFICKCGMEYEWDLEIGVKRI